MAEYTQKVHVEGMVEGDRQPKIFSNEAAPNHAPTSYMLMSDTGECLGVLDHMSIDKSGVTNEALLHVVKDCLEHYQMGIYNCPENTAAIAYINNAIMALNDRTMNRMLRGVANTLIP